MSALPFGPATAAVLVSLALIGCIGSATRDQPLFSPLPDFRIQFRVDRPGLESKRRQETASRWTLGASCPNPGPENAKSEVAAW